MTKEIELAKQHGIQYRLTPEGTKEMWCYDRNVQAFAEALVAAERERWAAKCDDVAAILRRDPEEKKQISANMAEWMADELRA